MGEQTPQTAAASGEPAAAPAAVAAVAAVAADLAGPATQPASRTTPVFPVLFSVTALLLSGWTWWQGQQADPAFASMDAAVAAQDLALDSLREQLAAQFAEQQQAWQQLETTLQAELAAASTREVARNEQLAALQAELAALQRRVEENNNPVTATSRELLLAEAAGLLRLARERLLTAGDVTGAIRLYLAADALLQPLADSAAFSVREVLARELGTLRALPEVDVQGLYARLGALAARIDGIRVQSDATADFSVDAPATPAATEDNWYAGISAALARYFVVTRQDGPVQPLLGSEQQYQIRRGIQLQLEQARLALLRGQAQVWQTALAEAEAASMRWLMDDGSGNHARLLAELRELQATAITPDIPALDSTLRVLQQVLQSAATGATP